MDRDQIRSRIADILSDLLDRDGIVLSDATTADQVDGWDSLSHLRLLVAIEGELAIGFQVSELNPGNVGELVDVIQSKLRA